MCDPLQAKNDPSRHEARLYLDFIMLTSATTAAQAGLGQACYCTQLMVAYFHTGSAAGSAEQHVSLESCSTLGPCTHVSPVFPGQGDGGTADGQLPRAGQHLWRTVNAGLIGTVTGV